MLIEWCLYTHSERRQHFQSLSLFLTIAQNGLVLFKKNDILKTIHLLHNDNVVSVGLQRSSSKIGNIVTLYHRELLKKIPSPGIFCTQSVLQGLRSTMLKELDSKIFC